MSIEKINKESIINTLKISWNYIKSFTMKVFDKNLSDKSRIIRWIVIFFVVYLILVLFWKIFQVNTYTLKSYNEICATEAIDSWIYKNPNTKPYWYNTSWLEVDDFWTYYNWSIFKWSCVESRKKMFEEMKKYIDKHDWVAITTSKWLEIAFETYYGDYMVFPVYYFDYLLYIEWKDSLINYAKQNDYILTDTQKSYIRNTLKINF